jgi:hypothetical protein
MQLYFGEYNNACFDKQHHVLCDDYKWWMHKSGDCHTGNGFSIAEHAECGTAITTDLLTGFLITFGLWALLMILPGYFIITDP